MLPHNLVGYWTAPCGVDILTTDGTSQPLTEHVRRCGACHDVLRARYQGKFVQYGKTKVFLAEDVAKALPNDK